LKLPSGIGQEVVVWTKKKIRGASQVDDKSRENKKKIRKTILGDNSEKKSRPTKGKNSGVTWGDEKSRGKIGRTALLSGDQKGFAPGGINARSLCREGEKRVRREKRSFKERRNKEVKSEKKRRLLY